MKFFSKKNTVVNKTYLAAVLWGERVAAMTLEYRLEAALSYENRGDSTETHRGMPP